MPLSLLCRVAIKCSLIGSLRFGFPLICAECTWAGEYKSLPWPDPCCPLNLQKCKWLHDLQGRGSQAWFVLAGGDLGKGAPPAHPGVFLPQENKDITKNREMGDREASEFLQPSKTNTVPSQISKKICNFWKLKCPASKRYYGAPPAWFVSCWILPVEIKLNK